ncbi:CHAT domain-containing protein [Variovorax sp. J22P240]|uniref:CHAT domain-containing protein n=1 Tax=Variovorax sp. J22P240 TaxID=3053514 RepID=UPI002578C7C2|nr:CHAT domain-containing protein [Variovorax sp. J22P240]MDM0001830.1 CHAT domain-containing protein [Variovorax sp. J22P240]
MPDIRETKLELLRNGPEHNQLLSPLTPYIALCGAWAPQTVTMPFEHRELITRLARLRYSTGGNEVSAEQSESELVSLGTAVGRVLGEVPGLQAALTDIGRDGAHLVHLRLALSALELGMVPFEAAIAPDNLPGSGAPLLLRTPTVITREIRRSQPIGVNWNRDHRILFAFATPPGMAQVPAQQHLDALRRAIEPFVPIIRNDPARRVQEVQKQLTVLPEASLKAIGDACRAGDYTHVHILAHGAPLGEGASRRYGVALRDESRASGYKVVDGETLGVALRGAESSSAGSKALPTFLSLATCDSGAVDSVVVPGGSIAHELHRVGIPWVVASQFPLWMSASTIMVESLYSGILSADDPRVVLYQLRQRLRVEVPETHDWASIVAYAISPWDFDRQIEQFFDRQVRRRLNVKFARIDELAKLRRASAAANTTGLLPEEAEFSALKDAIRKEHAAWLARPSVNRTPTSRAEALGMSAASEKRIAIAYAMKAQAADEAGDPKGAKDALKECDAAYLASRQGYRQAVELDPTNHWAITQFVSIAATPRLMGDDTVTTQVAAKYAPWWNASRQIARWQLRAATGLPRAWALGTLAELELLGSVYEATAHDPNSASARITDACREIVQLTGGNSFAVSSTRRQFERYLKDWKHERWRKQAEAALRAFDNDD